MKKRIPVFGLTSGMEYSRPSKPIPPVKYVLEPPRGFVYRASPAPEPKKRYLP